MLVHFISGPHHGCSEAIQNPGAVIRVPALEKPVLYAFGEVGEFPDSSAQLEILIYKITRRTRRYCIAEYEEPKVRVDFRVALSIDTWDTAGRREFEDVLRTWRESSIRHGNIRLLSMERCKLDETDITFGVTVDGPADPMAVAEAGEQLQHFLDSNFPAYVRRSIAHVGSQGGVRP